LALLAASWATPALTVAITVPECVIPPTVTVYVVPDPVTVAVVAPAVSAQRDVASCEVTDRFAEDDCELDRLTVDGSDCEPSWLIVTGGLA
jgi:hypothetical protein